MRRIRKARTITERRRKGDRSIVFSTQDGEVESKKEDFRDWRKERERERERDIAGETVSGERQEIVMMEGRRFNNVTMNERPSERAPRRLPGCAASAESRDRRLNCKITERGTMRPGTTLCLHLNNPRARGYVIRRAPSWLLRSFISSAYNLRSRL